MDIQPIAFFRSPFTSKFGIPRQSGLVDELRGRVSFTEDYRDPAMVRGLEGFSHAWLVWGFSENEAAPKHATVRPPRLGGNRHLGVFATRSPFRPNNLGLSCVRIVEIGQGEVVVAGADLMDGTPIYDLKPYVPLTDCRPAALGGFTDTDAWRTLRVEMGGDLRGQFGHEEAEALVKALEQDPRPQYHDDAGRVYGMPFAGRDVRFRVSGGTLTVVDVV